MTKRAAPAAPLCARSRFWRVAGLSALMSLDTLTLGLFATSAAAEPAGIRAKDIPPLWEGPVDLREEQRLHDEMMGRLRERVRSRLRISDEATQGTQASPTGSRLHDSVGDYGRSAE
jgi:hypothetical protein